jgi:hypothetical protein
MNVCSCVNRFYFYVLTNVRKWLISYSSGKVTPKNGSYSTCYLNLEDQFLICAQEHARYWFHLNLCISVLLPRLGAHARRFCH